MCGLCIHQLFERQAAANPDATALEFAGIRLSYATLNEQANQMAHYLRGLGVGPEALVALYMDRRPELVISILAILKAGGAYVPIDPAYPSERIAFMLADARSPVLITQDTLQGRIQAGSARIVSVDQDASAILREDASNPDLRSTAEALAYVIYTSGSTGKPKGSLITHRNVVRLFQVTEPWFHFGRADVWTLFHSCAFDFSVWELWGALAYGGRLVVVPFAESRSPEGFYRLLCESGVTVLNQTPSAFRQLARAEESAGQSPKLALRYVIFGGEVLDMKNLKPWFDRHGDQRPQLVNMYGITETTVHVTYRPLRAADVGGPSVIGVPLPDLQVHLLDESQRPVQQGQPGEVYVGGAGLGRGYLNRPDLTAQKFIPDPFSQTPGARLYASGDSGRLLPNGDLEYLGRLDQQVKIRGFRVELGEIEAVLSRHPGVRESVVVARDNAAGEKQLVAYLIRRAGDELSLPALRQMLRERLPEFMVPAAFMFIDKLPLTTNGKLDVRALPAPDEIPSAPVAPSARPATELQMAIATCWQEALQKPTVGLDDNFFDVGGNSILLAVVHMRLQTLLKRVIPITDLFAYSTIRALAQHFLAAPTAAGGSNPVLNRAAMQREAIYGDRCPTRR